jgi:hypothetical protein
MTDTAEQVPAHSAATTIDPGSAMLLLREIASAGLYRSNVFRVIGAPVHATARDIARRSERLKLAEKVGPASAPAPRPGPLALDPPPGADAVREALQRVRDPERRLVEELFWFWPLDSTDGRPDAALASLEQGDTMAALEAWCAPDSNRVGLHNRAVLFHAIALDLEQLSASLDEAGRHRRDRCWRESMASWRETIEQDPFWERLAARIREIDDRRLSTGMARRIRSLLPTVLLSVNARLAVTAAERGDDDEADRHMTLIDDSGFDRGEAERALEVVLEPLRQRVLTFCKEAEAASSDPTKAHQVAADLLDHAAPLLLPLRLLRERHPMRESAHDEVAQRAITCGIAYGDKTEDWETAIALFARILPICGSASARSRLERNLEIYRKNIAANRCWFCEANRSDESSGVEVKLHGNVQHLGTRVSWNTLTIKVPRCAGCRSQEHRAFGWAALVFIVSTAVCVVSCNAGASNDAGFAIGWGGAIAGALAAVATAFFVMGGRKNSMQASSSPVVKGKLAEGWAFGEKPAGVQ